MATDAKKQEEDKEDEEKEEEILLFSLTIKFLSIEVPSRRPTRDGATSMHDYLPVVCSLSLSLLSLLSCFVSSPSYTFLHYTHRVIKLMVTSSDFLRFFDFFFAFGADP